MSAEFAQACDFMFATLKWFAPVPGLGPELCHDRGLASPHPRDCVGVTVALPVGVTSVIVSGLAYGRCQRRRQCTRAPLWPLPPAHQPTPE